MTDPHIAKRDQYMSMARKTKRMLKNAPKRLTYLDHFIPNLVRHARNANHQSIRNRRIHGSH